MGKVFKVTGAEAKEILAEYGYWFYYDSGYHHITMYIYLDSLYSFEEARWHYCDSNYTEYNSRIDDNKTYELKIEHHDYDYITNAHAALMKALKQRQKQNKGEIK